MIHLPILELQDKQVNQNRGTTCAASVQRSCEIHQFLANPKSQYIFFPNS